MSIATVHQRDKQQGKDMGR